MEYVLGIVERRLEALLATVAGLVYSVARFTTVAQASIDGESDSVDGQPLTPDENGGTSQDNVRRLGGSWGVWGMPPAGEPCLVVRAGGGGTNGVIVAAGGKRYAPANLADGDSALYCKQAGVTVALSAASKTVTLQADSGTIAVGGSTATAVNLSTGTFDVLLKTQAMDSLGVPITQAYVTITKAS